MWASDTWWNNKTERREAKTGVVYLISRRMSVFYLLFFSLGKHHLFLREVKSPMAGHPVYRRKYCGRSTAMYIVVLLGFKVSAKTKPEAPSLSVLVSVAGSRDQRWVSFSP